MKLQFGHLLTSDQRATPQDFRTYKGMCPSDLRLFRGVLSAGL